MKIERTVVASFLVLVANCGFAEGLTCLSHWRETPEQKSERMAWWMNDRFGMFIHFGLYSMAARHEWVLSRERLSDEAYRRYFDYFSPDRFDARKWAKAAREAGMKYAVLTAKHHDGFCLWDSAVTDYKVTKTGFGRDVVREFVDAFRAEGLRVGLYYSLVDWHHPDYTIDSTHPRRPARFKGEWDMRWSKENLTNELARLNAGRDMSKYRRYVRDQVTELLTKYGKIDLLWFDWVLDPAEPWCKTAVDYDSVGLLELVRRLQPNILVNNRLGLKKYADGWDFASPEQGIHTEWERFGENNTRWETCHTFSGSWGYYRDEKSWKTPHQLIDLLVKSVSYGGNLIMNVGPTSRGNFDERADASLAVYGKWLRDNARAIYGCTSAPEEFEPPEGTRLTWNPATKRLYIHILDYPFSALECRFVDRIAYAQFLHDGSEIPLNWASKLDVPVPAPAVEVPVIEIMLKEASRP